MSLSCTNYGSTVMPWRRLRSFFELFRKFACSGPLLLSYAGTLRVSDIQRWLPQFGGAKAFSNRGGFK